MNRRATMKKNMLKRDLKRRFESSSVHVQERGESNDDLKQKKKVSPTADNHMN